jgi:hypothetical protein
MSERTLVELAEAYDAARNSAESLYSSMDRSERYFANLRKACNARDVTREALGEEMNRRQLRDVRHGNTVYSVAVGMSYFVTVSTAIDAPFAADLDARRSEDKS